MEGSRVPVLRSSSNQPLSARVISYREIRGYSRPPRLNSWYDRQSPLRHSWCGGLFLCLERSVLTNYEQMLRRYLKLMRSVELSLQHLMLPEIAPYDGIATRGLS